MKHLTLLLIGLVALALSGCSKAQLTDEKLDTDGYVQFHAVSSISVTLSKEEVRKIVREEVRAALMTMGRDSS